MNELDEPITKRIADNNGCGFITWILEKFRAETHFAICGFSSSSPNPFRKPSLDL